MVAKNAGKALKNFEEKEHRFIRASSADPDVLVDTVAARVWGTRILLKLKIVAGERALSGLVLTGD